jgi:tetratricopeptide (TPR) repeat protein
VAGFASISQDQLLDRIAGRLEWERTRQPAFTLLLGSGFSAPLIPTAGQVVARDVAWWLYWRRRAREGDVFELRPASDADEMRSFERELWTSVCAECAGSFELQDSLPATDAENVGGAYRAIMSGLAARGLSDPQRRRRYLRDLCARIGERVNGAHIFLASILRAQERWAPDQAWKRPFCRTIFTTNFDPLLQRSLQLVSRLYFMSDRPEALEPPEDEDQDAIHLVYSHGSVHRYLLLNTTEEIEKARARNAPALVPYLQRHGVLVIGYSGWLDATMEALSHCNSFDGNLYWCDLYRPEEAAKRLSTAARELLASKAGYAYYVPIAGADELMLALHRKLGLGDAPGFIRDPIGQMIEDLVSVEVPNTREPANEPRAIDTLKDSRDRTVTRLRAAQQVFEKPEQVQAGGPREVTAGDQRVYDEAVTAKLMAEALEKAQAGVLDQAIQLWTKISKDERLPAPIRARALFNQGVTHELQGNADQAIADYTAVIAMPDAPAERAWALYNRGIAGGRLGLVDQEIADYTAVIATPDASPELIASALFNRAVGHKQLGQMEEAIADYTAVLAMPDAPADQRVKSLHNRGVAHAEQGRADQAIADCTAVIAMPDVSADQRAKALVNRGVAHGKQGRADQEIADYTAVIAMPDVSADQRAKALFNRGVAHRRQGRTDQEIADYSTVIAMPDAPASLRAKALVNRGVAHGKQSRADQEIADCTVVIAMPDAASDERARALVNRGAAHGKLGLVDEEIADYTAMIAMPDGPADERAFALINRGVAHGKRGRADQEVEDYRAVIAMPDAPAGAKAMALGNRAWGRFMAEPPDTAGLREDSEAALAIDPHLTFARLNLGLALLLAGDSQRATAEYARAAGEASTDEIRSHREDLERATADKQVPGTEEILDHLRAREAELAASAEQPPAAPASGSG